MHAIRSRALAPRLSLILAMSWFALQGDAVRAEDISVTSQIDAVTVFPTGAEVTRAFDVTLQPGEHRLLVLLPHDIQPDSIQIKADPASGVSISALDLKPSPIDPSEGEAQKAAILAQIAALQGDVARHRKTQENANFAFGLVQILAERKLQPTGPESTPPVPDPQALITLLDLVDGRLSQISATMLDAQAKIATAEAEIAELKAKLSASPAAPPPAWLAMVHVLATKGSSASFRIGYRLTSASWEPIYEARLSTDGAAEDGARLELARTALVVQTTSEDWTDVALTLSTAQRTSSVSVPGLQPQTIRAFIIESDQDQSQNRTASAKSDGAGGTGVAPSLATNLGFNVLFPIPGRVNVEKTGTSKTVRIGTGEGKADLFLSAAPKLDVTAYLGARATANVNTPLLPGRVMLFRDGVFVGQGYLPLTRPGETMLFGFGADDLVSIERREVDRKSGETGLVSTAYIEERAYKTTIISGHSFSIPITIRDQVPVSEDERIRVDLLQDTTTPDDDETDVTDGLYAWTRELEPGTPQEIRFAFRVTWPKGMTR